MSKFFSMGVFDIFNLLDPDKKISDQNLYNSRLKTCNACDLRTRVGTCGDGVRRGCGCIVKEKAKLRPEHGGVCPLGKWHG